jgi:ribosomal protein S8
MKTYRDYIADLNAENNKRKIVLLVRQYKKDRDKVISRIKGIRENEKRLYNEVQSLLRLGLDVDDTFEELAALKIGRDEIKSEPAAN